MIKIILISVLMALNIKIIHDYTSLSIAKNEIHPLFTKKSGLNIRKSFLISSKIGEILFFIFPFIFASWYLAIFIIIGSIIIAKLITIEGPMKSEDVTIASWFIANLILVFFDIFILKEIIQKYN